MEKIKVFLADPQVLFREGIHFTLSGEEDFEVSGEATSNEDAFVAIEANPPTIAILNMKDSILRGPEITCRIKRSFPSVSVILVMDGADEEQLFLAIMCGASACLTKDTDPEYLVNIIREVVQGGQPIIEALLLSGMASKALAEFEALSPLSAQMENIMARLSVRETEILKSIADGSTLEQTAVNLNSDEEAIRKQLGFIIHKLVSNDQARMIIEITQRSLPSMVPGPIAKGRPAAEYVTKEEFNEFKDSLMQRFKSFVGELA